MNNRDFEALIIVIILLFVFAIILTPIIALWAYIILQNSKRKRIRERILAARSDVIGNKRWFPARYAGQQRFDSFFKFCLGKARASSWLRPAACSTSARC